MRSSEEGRLYSEQNRGHEAHYSHVGTKALPSGREPLDRGIYFDDITIVSFLPNGEVARQLSETLKILEPHLASSDKQVNPHEFLGGNVYNWRNYNSVWDYDQLRDPVKVRQVAVNIAASPRSENSKDLNLEFLALTERVEEALIATNLFLMFEEAGWANKAAESMAAKALGKHTEGKLNEDSKDDSDLTLFINKKSGFKLCANLSIPKTSGKVQINSTKIKIDPPQGIQFSLIIKPCDNEGNTLHDMKQVIPLLSEQFLSL